MNLLGLIDNTAQTLNVVRKNSQASDNIANDFLKSKKSLGSNDRRFVLDLLFFTIRNLTLIDYISKELQSNDFYLQSPLDLSKNENGKAKLDDFLAVGTALILAMKSIHFHGELSIDKYINKKELDIYHTLDNVFIESICRFSNWTRDEIINWIDFSINLYDLIYNSSINEVIHNHIFNVNDYNYSLLKYSFPEWIINDLLIYSSLNLQNIFSLAQSFTKSAPITIRLNDRLKDRQFIINGLTNDNIELKAGLLSPAAFHLSKRIYLSEHPLYKSGAIEIQDEASQLVSYALAPEDNWNILDACAGAGGKAVHLAALQKDSGNIVATDKEIRRLKEIPRRAANGAFSSIHTYLIDKNGEPIVKDSNVKFFNRRAFNAVLVDAPCSGMGTLRREPMKKYRATRRLIEKLSQMQYEILSNYSKYLNIGGILIYATCSIMPQENDLVVEKFLAENPDFAPDPLFNAFDKYGISIAELKNDDYKHTFYPHLYGTDGFFIARMKKIG